MPKKPTASSTKLRITKITAPAISEDWVRRRDLIDRLTQGLSKRVTVVSAAAGYGKSTLAAQWIDSQSQDSVWLSLDKGDGELDVFVRHLSAAFESELPDFGAQTLRALQGTTMPPPSYLAEAFSSAILSRQVPMVIVLDDFHLAASPPVLEFVSHCIEIVPKHVHWLLLSRERPTLPLNLWATRGWLNEFSSDDLAFSVAETREYFADSSISHISSEQLTLIQQRTEGWPAGLRMITLAQTGNARSPALPSELSRAGDFTAINYLAEQALHSQPPDIKHFLGVTAGLERFCASLCDELRKDQTTSTPSEKLIREIECRNLFIVRLDPMGKWYRYHHLFRQLLVRRQTQLAEGLDPRTISIRAGQWFADNGEVEEAISLWVDAGDLKAAADLVWRNLPETLEADISRRTLRRWLAAFPPASLKQHTGLLLADAFIKALSYDWSAVAELVDLAEDRLNQSLPNDIDCSHSELLGVARALQSARYFWQSNIESSMRNAKLALQDLPPRHSTARTAAHQYLAGCMTVTGKRNEALHYLKEVEISDASSGSRNVAPLLVAQAFIYLLSANLDDALECVSRIDNLPAMIGHIDYWMTDVHFIRGFEALERNRLAEAEAEFNKAIPYRYSTNARHYHEILIGLAKVSLAQGQYADADERLKAARAFALEACDPGSIRISESMEARLTLARTNKVSCDSFKVLPADAVSFWMEVPTVTFAELKLLQANSDAQLQQATRFIDEALKNAQSQGTTRQVIILSLLKALALESLGDVDAAITMLEAAVEMARPLRLLRTFLEQGTSLGRLIDILASRKVQDDYVRELSEIFRRQSVPAEARLDDITGFQMLSDRELDVLVLMSQRKSNKEIAAELYISYETVKNHAKSIYRKLDVHSRREAVARAQGLGLDTPR